MEKTLELYLNEKQTNKPHTKMIGRCFPFKLQLKRQIVCIVQGKLLEWTIAHKLPRFMKGRSFPHMILRSFHWIRYLELIIEESFQEMACSMKRKTWRNSFCSTPSTKVWFKMDSSAAGFDIIFQSEAGHANPDIRKNFFLRGTVPPQKSAIGNYIWIWKASKWRSPNTVTKANSFTDAR